ncbi:phosphotransferase [Carnobacteriaceae bacterium 52-44]
MYELLKPDVIKVFEEINKGWSADKKYYIQTNDQQEFLMRTSSIELYERKNEEFKKMQEIFSLGLPISEPLDFLIHKDKDMIQALFTWIDGQDSEKILSKLEEKTQYDLGYQAGEILKKIHTLPAPNETKPWTISYQQKIERNISNYKNGELKYNQGELFLEYIAKNRHLVNNRPLTFQHGDYHTGNMILSSMNELSIIDFNRWSYGDPWEEFDRIDFSAMVSPLFATGQVDGYFSGKPPFDFFQLMALYICTNILNALPWALSYSKKEVKTMKDKATDVLKWYDNMQSVVPNWYIKDARKKYDKK